MLLITSGNWTLGSFFQVALKAFISQLRLEMPFALDNLQPLRSSPRRLFLGAQWEQPEIKFEERKKEISWMNLLLPSLISYKSASRLRHRIRRRGMEKNLNAVTVRELSQMGFCVFKSLLSRRAEFTLLRMVMLGCCGFSCISSVHVSYQPGCELPIMGSNRPRVKMFCCLLSSQPSLRLSVLYCSLTQVFRLKGHSEQWESGTSSCSADLEALGHHNRG